MRIAVYHNLPSGGGKRALCEMTRRLAQRHDIDVFTLSCAEHEFGDLRPYCGAHYVFPFRPGRFAHSPFGRANQAIRVADLLRARALQRHIGGAIDALKYDVVFAHSCLISQAPAILQFLRTPTVYYCAEPPRHLYEPPPIRPYADPRPIGRFVDGIDPLLWGYRRTLKTMDLRSTRASTRVLANSHYSRETMYRVYGIFAHVCYLGVDASLFRPLDLPRENFVLSVGHIAPHKGFDFLIRSLGLMAPGARPGLVLVGNATVSAEKRYLLALAQQHGVAVDFKERVPDEALVSLYNRAVLTLYAPTMEPFGFVPIESMSCGTPVVGVREAGVRETVLHAETGLLTERDERLFSAAIVSLLDNPDLRRAYGERARQHTRQHFRWEQSIEQLETHFAEAGSRRAT